MKIQFNTDKTIVWNQTNTDHFSAKIQDELERFSPNITRLEIHISDENGKKEGFNDIRCLIEARVESHQPIAVTEQANTIEHAVSGATEKIKAALKTLFGRIKN